jgi:hypothetical protein
MASESLEGTAVALVVSREGSLVRNQKVHLNRTFAHRALTHIGSRASEYREDYERAAMVFQQGEGSD